MSILIKGMEMPREDGAIIVYKIGGKFFAQRGRADKLCPLIEIHEPHGRLIDADALGQDAQKRMLMCNKNDNQFQKPYEVIRAIALAPAIIPAEGGASDDSVDLRRP